MTGDKEHRAMRSKAPLVPEPYRQLAPSIDLLSDSMAQLIGGLLPSFSDLPDPMIERVDERQGDFIGYSGITNRGRTDHLLLSEWALQSIYPAEFVRRFAEGEALYSQREFRREGSRTIYVAMVSCGPQSMGHGRFISLACLFHLAALAQRQNARLHWCALIPGQDEKAVAWHEGITRKSLRALVVGATTFEPDEADLGNALRAFENGFAAQIEAGDRIAHWAITPHFDLHGKRSLLREHAAYALSYERDSLSDLAQPMMRLRLLRRGRSLAARTIKMPEQDLCLAAMRRPLEPVLSQRDAKYKASWSSGKLLSKRWEMRSWMFVPNHFAAIRIEKGVLFLDRRVRHVKFLQMRDGEVLVGMHIKKKAVQYITFSDVTGRDELTLQERHWSEPDVETKFSVETQSHHLFRGYSPASMPIMPIASHTHAKFFSASGSWYQMREVSGADRTTTEFKSLPTQGSILYADGIYALELPPQNAVSGYLTVVGISDQRLIMALPVNLIEQMPKTRKPRAVLISPSTRTLALCLGGRKWRVYFTLEWQRHDEQVFDDNGKYLTSSCEIILNVGEQALSIERAKGKVRVLIWVGAGAVGKGSIVRAEFNGDIRADKILVESQDLEGRYVHLRCDPRDGAIWAMRLQDDGDEWVALERLYAPKPAAQRGYPASIERDELMDHIE